MTRTGFADLGTNTFNYLIADLNAAGQVHFIEQGKIPVMLGKSGLRNGQVGEDRIAVALDAMRRIRDIFRMHGVEHELALATSAIRSASNGKDIVLRIKKESGFDVEVIDGDREAELIFKGVNYSGMLPDSCCLIMDIGGGSTEFILALGKTLLWKKSYPLGVARVMEQVNPADPIGLSDEDKTRTLFDASLDALWEACAVYKPVCLIGSSGSFDTFADLVNAAFNYPALDAHSKGYRFNLQEFQQICQVLKKSSRSERMNMKGMIEMRVDYIVLAALFTEYVLERIGLNDLRLSCYALKEGALLEQLEKLNP